MSDWYFPSNGGGQIRGIADAGIETFKGKEILSLTREVCQNSLDAAANENSPVRVEFKSYGIRSRNIPGYSEYKQVLNKCRDFWKASKDATDFFNRAIRELQKSTNYVLRISDYNTTGLADPFKRNSKESWNTLVKIDGGAMKSGDSAGKFGIGKNAPFTTSFYRIVFYRTLNEAGERAAQGISRLVSFPLNLFRTDIAAGVGYYGDKDLPVANIPELDSLCKRNEVGTDIFIYGFNYYKEGAYDTLNAVIENFLVSIHRDKLRVKIGETEINKDNLGKYVSHYDEKMNKAKFRKNVEYYKILTDTSGAVKTFSLPFHDLGTFKLRVLYGDNFSRKILVVRKAGMKLFDWAIHELSVKASIKCAGILELEGEELNEFFRDMETPAHNEWDYDRHLDKSTARKYLRELKEWIKAQIEGNTKVIDAETFDVLNLGDMLSADPDDITPSPEEDETLDPNKNPKEAEQKDPNKKPLVEETVPATKKKPGTHGQGDSDATDKSTGDGDGNGSRDRKGKEDPDGKNKVAAADSRNKKVRFKNLPRVIKVGEKKYLLIFKVNQDISEGQIKISVVGENNKGEELSVTTATSDNVMNVRADKDKIKFANLVAGAVAKIKFELAEEKNYSLGVTVYENKS